MAIPNLCFIPKEKVRTGSLALDSNPTLSKITSAHFHGWEKGLKTLCYYVRTKAISTGAKHLAVDISKTEKPKSVPETPKIEIIQQKPTDSPFECFGCSS